MNDLIGIAHSVASHFYLPGWDHDDFVQEALLAAWLHPQPTKTRYRTVMRRTLGKIIKKGRRTPDESFNEVLHSPLDPQIIPIPRTKKMEKVLLALVLSRGFICDAAEVLGVSRWKMYKLTKELREEI